MPAYPARYVLRGGRMTRQFAKRLTWLGGAGTVIAALCCFTPLLVIALGTLGMATLVTYLDAFLLPLLALFVLIFAVGLHGWLKSP